MKHLLLFFVILAIDVLNAQTSIDSLFTYSPTHNDLELNIDIVLLKKSNGTGNYDLKSKEERDLLNDYLKHGQSLINNLKELPPNSGCNKDNDFYKSVGLDLQFNIKEVSNSFYWDFNNSGSDPKNKKYNGFVPSSNWYMKPLDDSLTSIEKLKPAIHAYFTIDGNVYDEVINSGGRIYNTSSVAAGQSPSKSYLNRSSQIHMPNRYLKYILHKEAAPENFKTTWAETRGWHLNDVKGFIHELGHVLGLSHSNKHHRRNKCEYSIMSQVGSAPRNYLQPSEIRKIHSNLATTNLMQFVSPSSHYGNTVKILEDTEISKTRRIYSNIEVKKGVDLTISDSIVMPLNSFIKLQKKAILKFNKGGKITYPDGSVFNNYILKKRSKINYE